MLLISIFLSLAIAFYIFHLIRFNYWKKRGIPNPKPHPLVGNILPVFLLKKSLGDVMTEIYRKYEGYPCVGYFKGTTPVLLLRDPEMIKTITVKDFQHFGDNEQVVDKELDPLFGRNPFVLKGQEWKVVRAQLTPCFTSGKMKFLFPMLLNVGKSMITYVDKNIQENKGKATFELKELCVKFTLDNISTCVYGIEGQCFEKENPKVRDMARRLLTPGTFSAVAITFLMAFPWIQKYIPIKFVKKDVEDDLIKLVKSSMQHRKENNIVRNDFMDIIGQLKETCTAFKFTDVDLAAHMSSFFGDGYETSSVVMSFAVFELACNPDAQTRLREEIEEALEKHGGQLTYDAVNNEMPYLDAVLEESLRKNTPVSALSKVCTKTYTYHSEETEDFKEMTLTIEKDSVVSLPLTALAHDPKYFEDPDKFIPERFLEDKNKYKYKSMPFGEGPRQCLGRRFGLLQIRVGIIRLVSNYEFRLNNKTKLPLEFDPTYLLLSAKGGLWADFYKLKK